MKLLSTNQTPLPLATFSIIQDIQKQPHFLDLFAKLHSNPIVRLLHSHHEAAHPKTTTRHKVSLQSERASSSCYRLGCHDSILQNARKKLQSEQKKVGDRSNPSLERPRNGPQSKMNRKNAFFEHFYIKASKRKSLSSKS